MTSRYTQWAVVRDIGEHRRGTIVSVHSTRDAAFDALDAECDEDTDEWQVIEVPTHVSAEDRIWV